MGIFLGVAVAFAATASWRGPIWRRVLRIAVEAGIIAIGPVLLLSQISIIEALPNSDTGFTVYNEPKTLFVWSLVYVASATLAVFFARLKASAGAGGDDARDGTTGARTGARALMRARGPVRDTSAASSWSVPRIAAGLGAFAALVILVVLFAGTGAGDLVQGVVVRPIGQASALAHLPAMPMWLLAWCLLVPTLAAVGWAVTNAPPTRSWLAMSGLLRALAATAIFVATVPFVRPGGSIFATLPCVAFVLLPRLAGHPSDMTGSRHFLVGLAVVQNLHAYPVAGAQVAWATYFAVVGAVVLIGDASSELLAAADAPARRTERVDRAQLAPAWRSALVGGPALVLLAVFAFVAIDNVFSIRRTYERRVPLAQPAERRLRLPATEAGLLAWLDDQLASCDEVMTNPGLNSVYVVLGIDPPTSFNATLWPKLLNDEEQQAIVDRFQASDGIVCQVVNPSSNAFGRALFGEDDTIDQPLEVYLRSPKFTVKATFEGWQVRTRSPA